MPVPKISDINLNNKFHKTMTKIDSDQNNLALNMYSICDFTFQIIMIILSKVFTNQFL